MNTGNNNDTDSPAQSFVGYARRQLADVLSKQSQPQTRDEHAILSGRADHYKRILAGAV